MPPEKELDPGRSNWEYLGSRLRFYRQQAGMTQGELAVKAYSSASFVSAVETGDRRPKAEFIRGCDEVLEADGDLVTLLRLALKESGALPAWVLPYAREEQRATRIRNYEPQVVPGLLQSAAYARALFGPLRLPQVEVDERVEARLQRQEILHRPDRPPKFWAVVDEGALSRLLADPPLARAQLSHMLSLMGLPHVVVEVLPVSVGMHASMDGNFALLDIAGKGVPGYAETLGDGRLIVEESRIEEIERRYDLLRAATLSLSASAQFLRELLEGAS